MMLREYWDKPFIGWLARKGGSFPVDQQGHTAGALRKAMAVLADGRILGIFPEGARSPDGSLLPGKAGVSLLMIKTGLPLLPAAIIGAEKALPKGRGYPLPFRITVRYGTPISFAPPPPRDRKAFLHRSTGEIMGAIEKLLGRDPAV
jgi:1-acyl-sn-glycerol-3-phosphate acyltransferase